MGKTVTNDEAESLNGSIVLTLPDQDLLKRECANQPNQIFIQLEIEDLIGAFSNDTH